MSIRAILFDMDGLLIDTEDLHMRAFADCASKLGYHREPHEYRVWIGHSSQKMSEWLVEQVKVKITPQAIVKLEQNIYLRLLREERPAPLLGAREMVGLCEEQNWKRGLVSSTVYNLVSKTMRVVLDHMHRDGELETHFASVTTGDRVPRMKPAPDPYELGAQGLGVTPAECLVFEDSPAGVASARAAGCKVVAIPNMYLDRGEILAKEPHAHFDTLSDAYAARIWEKL